MMQIKDFDPAVLASITSGVLMTEFRELHAAAEFIMGRTLRREDLADLAPRLKRAVLGSYPDMPTIVGAALWKDARDAVRARYGSGLDLIKGCGCST